MLVEIKSDCFKYGNKTARPPIVFNKGLNVILGGTAGDNSIGKSTFLLILDFVFGGKDYLDSNAVGFIPDQEIFFCFDFGNGKEYFARNTSSADSVYKCNENYEKQNPITLKEFQKYLYENYKLNGSIKSFRDITNPFFRIYGKSDFLLDSLLNVKENKNQKEAVTRLEQLMNMYSGLESYKKTESETDDKSKTYNKWRRYKFEDNTITTEKAKKAAEIKIEELKAKFEQTLIRNDIGVSELNQTNSDRIIVLKTKLKTERSLLTRISMRIESIKENLNQTSFIPDKTINQLTKFFPDVNIQRINDIESFHIKLADILKVDFEEELKILEIEKTQKEKSISEIETELRSLGTTANLSKSQIEELNRIQEEIRQLEGAIDSKSDADNYAKAAENAKKERENAESNVLRQIENLLNTKVLEYNNFLYDEKLLPPKLELFDGKKYKYCSENDDGAGHTNKDIIIFDLAMLEKTELPNIIHDTNLFKQMENPAVKKLLDLYVKCQKQVFIALDEKDKYASNVLDGDAVVLKLSNEDPLFGEKWNRK